MFSVFCTILRKLTKTSEDNGGKYEDVSIKTFFYIEFAPLAISTYDAAKLSLNTTCGIPQNMPTLSSLFIGCILHGMR